MTALSGADAPTVPRQTAALPAPARVAAPWGSRDPLRRALSLLDVDRSRVGLSITLGVLGLGSAVALAGVAAWLIARASQMPPVLELSIATVAVRAFGIGRGVFRYLERLVSHDVALRGMGSLRTALYARLAAGRPEGTAAVRRGDLLARVGADVDAVGDAVVRGLLPAAVAAVLGLGTVVAMAALLPAAGATLAACLLLAGVVAPWLAARGARTAEQRAVTARASIASISLGLLDDPGALAVQGRIAPELAALRRSDADLAEATDAGAGPAALAAALGSLAVGVAVLAALLLGIPAVAAGALTPVALAVIVLTPLAAFEATSVLPAAAIQVHRSRAAAARIMALLDEAEVGDLPDPAAQGPTTGAPSLVARGLACAWPGHPPVVTGIDLDLSPGRSIAVVGPSGTGKTTLLLTLAGLLPPHAGTVDLGGVAVSALPRETAALGVALTAEDAHVFATSVLENLRVARGDVTPDEARGALARAGLTDWLDGLPDGVDTRLGPDAQNVSGGERRRLLLARALVAPAPLLLVDEPGEHLDRATADHLVRDLLTQGVTGTGVPARTAADRPRGVVVVTHRLTPLDAADEVVLLKDGRVEARGTHAELLRTHDGYREAMETERDDD
ncbi:MAG TPA: thiol reductant ABC exporter subunit CydC [Cellulomonas sp.]|uniref:thiol reductant ABC exporter subunit CydC n=1 Tax=Cellulomonas sp. TaxID=40001 RepID=UPI002E341712|nr:thiol reductant ABC exporter subunit CydC [Cellulomonas sp.]HEX5332307.1 thiol reductant ABC exporter subunit CydC [Cellulomonas sp.]